MKLDSHCNVGIGTSTPATLLDVYGNAASDHGLNVRNASSNAAASARILLGNDSDQLDGWIQMNSSGNTTQGGARSLNILANAGDIVLSTQRLSPVPRITVKNAGNVGIGTTAPRGPLHIEEGNNGSYTFIQGGATNGNGTAFTTTDTIPVVSNAGSGPIGYNGLVLMPKEWGGTTADQHNILYLGGAQRTSGGTASTLAFGNWGYFSGTGAGAGGLGNATAQGDAAKFWMQLVDVGGEFTQRLDTVTRSATGTNTTAMSILSSGYVGIGTTIPTAKLEVAGDIVISGGGKITQEAWTAVTFTNSWTDYAGGFAPVSYYKGTDGRVYLRGLAASGTCSVSMFTLPVGYRPAYRHLLTTSSATAATRLDILADGTVVPMTNCSSTWVSLDGISFRVD